MTTDTTSKYIIRKLSEIETERGVCGWRKTLITHDDTPQANVSHLTIDNSRYHYHKEMVGYYYVLTGGGPGTATEPVALYTFTTLMQYLRFGYGSALSMVVFAVALLLALAYVRLLGRNPA